MSQSTITIDPVTRIEGHLKLEVEQEDDRVTEARCSGTMFRGIENIMQGRDPRDAPMLAERICGVCPQAHASASCSALDEAFGVTDEIPPNGRVLRNVLLAANVLQSHILHFYHLAALDYVDVTAAADYSGEDRALRSVKNFLDRGALEPYMPRYEGDYRLSDDENLEALRHYAQALDFRRSAHELLSLFGAKMPHQCTAVPGGVGTEVTADRKTKAYSYVADIRDFIENAYLPDVKLVAGRYPDGFQIGSGCGRFLSYGGFATEDEDLFAGGVSQPDGPTEEFDIANLREHVAHSFYGDECAGNPQGEGNTEAEPGKNGAYSWLKSPRYDGQACEVGPLARAIVGYKKGAEPLKSRLDDFMAEANLGVDQLDSALGRHAARALEAHMVADRLEDWIGELVPGEPASVPVEVPDEGEGLGLVAAPRGALAHWIRVSNGEIESYQAVVPTTWNGSPRDARDIPGPMEQALEGTSMKDADNPFEVVRIVRSFDPCLACAVHLHRPQGNERIEVPV
ncbi:MAG: nickel-dependent hydrogenase large subunit [Planctomycetota bacterium]